MDARKHLKHAIGWPRSPTTRMNLPRDARYLYLFVLLTLLTLLQLIFLPDLSCLRRELLRHYTSHSNSVRTRTSPSLLLSSCNSPFKTASHPQASSAVKNAPSSILNHVFDLRFAYNPSNDTIGFYYCPLPFSSSSQLIILCVHEVAVLLAPNTTMADVLFGLYTWLNEHSYRGGSGVD